VATYFTKSGARAAAKAQPQKLAKSFGDILAEDASKVSDWQSFDVFLSHSIVDAELILGVKVLLEKRGYSVYVDWETDKDLDRSTVSPKTAELLRTRMTQSKSLLYVATENAASSKWMPWELGYFDGLRKGGVAIFPLLDSEAETFRGQEYLGLYPVVTKDFYTGGVKADVFVEDRGNGWTTLDSFARGDHTLSKYG
jgi:hypothetical protein